MVENIIYTIIVSLMISFAQFIWMNGFYEKQRLKTWPSKLFLKEFFLLNAVCFGLSPVLFCVFHFDEILKGKFFRMFPFTLSVILYFIPLIILILIVEKHCDKSYKKIKDTTKPNMASGNEQN